MNAHPRFILRAHAPRSTILHRLPGLVGAGRAGAMNIMERWRRLHLRSLRATGPARHVFTSCALRSVALLALRVNVPSLPTGRGPRSSAPTRPATLVACASALVGAGPVCAVGTRAAVFGIVPDQSEADGQEPGPGARCRATEARAPAEPDGQCRGERDDDELTGRHAAGGDPMAKSAPRLEPDARRRWIRSSARHLRAQRQ